MSDLEPPRKRSIIFIIGAAGLLLAMGVDVLAVIGRHLGVSLLGSIELVQAAMLLASSAALVAATLHRQHASVHLLIDRISISWRAGIRIFNALLALLFFLALAAGSLWIAHDLWHAHEGSDLLKIPYAPLRIASIIALLTVAALFARDLRRNMHA
jgi:TRAP-type C4-dicarboxylate transport system permease small subunit